MSSFCVKNINAVWSTVLVCVLASVGFAQQGTSSGSVSRTRSQASNQAPVAPNLPPVKRKGVSSASVSRTRSNNSAGYYNESANAFVVPDDVAVDEFVNYHKHRLPLPKVGQAVAMDVRWGNDAVSPAQREAVLQIGFTTAEVTERTDLRPLNLALVIDKSGSMQAADKMSRVKQALRVLLGQLRENDFISIVAFDTDAEVLLDSQRLGDGRAARRAIDSIYPDGSTNLNAGLLLGYEQAMRNYRAKATNRVILLTDGIANVGEIAPARIAQNSLRFNDEGVDLSTIGVGAELDTDLLRTLAKSGRGLYHFVADNEDIEKVFVNEVQSLISPIARQVELTVDYDDDLQVEQIFGYEPRVRRNSVTIPIDDMNNGLTQVVLMRFRANNRFNDDYENGGRAVRVRLSYFDFKRQKTVEEVQEINLRYATRGAVKLLADDEVKKNYTIALLAQSIADMSQAARRRDYRSAQNSLETAISNAYNSFPSMQDKDVRRILNIAEDYQNSLRAINRRGE